MTTMDNSRHPKRVPVRLTPIIQSTGSNIPSPPSITSHWVSDEVPPLKATRTVGILKTISQQSEPEEPTFAIPESSRHDLAAYEARAKQQIDLKLEQTRREATERIEAELNAFRNQQISQLEIESDSIRQKAHDAGVREGRLAGEAAYATQINALLEAINSVTENKRKFLDNSEPELIKLALKVAEKIVQKQIEIDPTSMHAIVDQAIRRITDKDKVMIKTAPEDADLVRQYRDQILEKMPDIRTLEIHDDPRLEQGSIVIETRLGFIDSSIHTKLSSIESALLKIYNE